MRDVPERWRSWRVRLASPPAPIELPPALRLRATMIDSTTRSPDDRAPADFRSEVPDAHGIRRGLVAHIRQLIAAGQYDTPERWALAEEFLFRRTEESC